MFLPILPETQTAALDGWSGTIDWLCLVPRDSMLTYSLVPIFYEELCV